MLLYLDKNKEKMRLSLDSAQFVYECSLCNLPNFSKNSLIFRFPLHISRIFRVFSFDVVLFFDFCAKKSLRITHLDTETLVLERFGNLPSGKLPIKKDWNYLSNPALMPRQFPLGRRKYTQRQHKSKRQPKQSCDTSTASNRLPAHPSVPMPACPDVLFCCACS